MCLSKSAMSLVEKRHFSQHRRPLRFLGTSLESFDFSTNKMKFCCKLFEFIAEAVCYSAKAKILFESVLLRLRNDPFVRVKGGSGNGPKNERKKMSLFGICIHN